MGLDTTHNAWHGSYGSFNRFREWIASEIGINLEDYIGYSENGQKELSSIEHPIMPLLNHSDCDGILTNEEQKSIIKGGEMILENVKNKDERNEKDLYQFIMGCKIALEAKEDILFQ